MAQRRDLWVFAYGSLMWRPGFPFADGTLARLRGWRRSFCIYSRHYRGSPARPGLVLGLDRGGECEGIAFRVEAKDAGGVLHYLREREQVASVYREALVPITLLTPERAEAMAVAFLVERVHPSYAGQLTLAEQAHFIRGATGVAGSNIDYLFNTLVHLRDLGIRERALERLVPLVGAHVSRSEAKEHARSAALGLARGLRNLPVRRLQRLRREESNRFRYRSVLGVHKDGFESE
jgi:cation transport protein ChaC